MKKSTMVMNVAIYCAVLLVFSCAAGIEGNAAITLDLSTWVAGSSRSVLPSAVPYTVTSIEITVSGPGMTPVRQTFSPTVTRVTMQVPPGPSRTISLVGTVAPNVGPITKRTAEAVADLVAGNNNITLTTSFETKLIVPEYAEGSASGKVTQFDDISGAGKISQSIQYADDIDFDKYGRIYVARRTYPNNIRSLQYVGDPVATYLGLNGGVNGPTYAIAINRSAGILYHITSCAGTPRLCASSPITENDSGTDQLIIVGGVTLMSSSPGLAVDDEGMLYFFGIISSNPCIIKWNPFTSSIVGTLRASDVPQFSGLSPYDIITKGDFIYVSGHNIGGGEIIQVLL